jgi:hypothetical protein
MIQHLEFMTVMIRHMMMMRMAAVDILLKSIPQAHANLIKNDSF